MKKLITLSIVLFLGLSSVFSCAPYSPSVHKKTRLGVLVYKMTHPFGNEQVYVTNHKKTKKIKESSDS